MENIRKNFLLGINKEENKIYFGEIEIRSPRYWSKEKGNYTDKTKQDFSASFDAGEAFDIDEIDLQEQCQDLWDCYDTQTKLDLLYDGDRTREDVFDEWTRYSDYKEFKDCSCTDYETTIESGQTINFETTNGGQYDIRENAEEFKNIIFTDKKAVLLILELWDKYHLKNINDNIEEIENKVNEILERLDKYKSYNYENIENFIKKHIKEV